jgi:hypothetical protein
MPMDVGASWDARVTLGAHSILALEAGYVGSLNRLDVAGKADLVSHGLDGDLRLQLPYRVQPYIFGGVGYNHVAVNASSDTSAAIQATPGADQLTVPAGGGLSAYLGRNEHVTLDLRGTYRYIPDNNLSFMPIDHLHQWVAQARVGYTF